MTAGNAQKLVQIMINGLDFPLEDGNQIMHRLVGRNDGGGHIGKQRKSSRPGSHFFARGVEQSVVGAPVQGQGTHHFAVYFAEQIQDKNHNKQRNPRIFAGKSNGQCRNVEHRRTDVVSTDGRGFQFVQFLMPYGHRKYFLGFILAHFT